MYYVYGLLANLIKEACKMMTYFDELTGKRGFRSLLAVVVDITVCTCYTDCLLCMQHAGGTGDVAVMMM